ncbi:Ig-like domain-containing protein [Culturomica massiliensis]|uniref:Ig-like domain-containing protein n=1 Tax=Culturomica massiliensis TaxID=1841857 RepID=UPI0026706CEF|nr:Ig-like domain-containing protein [Culturomica massiliensis]
MKKHLFLLMLSAATILAGCSKDEGGNGDPFTPPIQEQLTQSAYADNENTGGGFSFTADAPWTATVNEVQAQAPALASVQVKSDTRAADNNGNNVVWLKLYNGNSEAYSGSAGTITLRIEIDQNYTGERREAQITIRSGNNTFTVTVVQEGIKQDGSQNEPPVKVTKITLDKTELSLESGAKATLTATVEPADATIKSVVWSSSNPEVVSVNPVTGEITAIANGLATVTATSSSNKEVSASCAVTVGGSDPEPQQKLLKKITVKTVDEDGESITTTKLTYDDQNRVSGSTTENFDGPGTSTTSTYTYETGTIKAVYDYTNAEGHGTGGATYKMDQSGYALSSHIEYIMDNTPEDKESSDVEYKYNADWQLTQVIEEHPYLSLTSQEVGRTVTSQTWENGNVITSDTYRYSKRADTEPSYRYKSTATYGTDKVTMNIDIVMGIGTMYVPGAYEDMLPVFGKMSEYLPVEIKSYYWSTSETKPSEPDEITKYQYKIVDGYLMQAIVTTTFSDSSVTTDTYEFEYE